MYTDAVSANGSRMVQVKDKLFEGCTADEKLFIEYRILNKIKYGATKSVSANFIAGLYESSGSVELMITSASFDSEGFDRLGTLHSVTITQMNSREFTQSFLEKLSTV